MALFVNRRQSTTDLDSEEVVAALRSRFSYPEWGLVTEIQIPNPDRERRRELELPERIRELDPGDAPDIDDMDAYRDYRERRDKYLRAVRRFRQKKAACSRRVDALGLRLWGLSSPTIYAFEVKVRRQDFYKELRNTEKSEAARELANGFYFATPAKLVGRGEVPAFAGLVWAYRSPGNAFGAKARIVKEAPESEPDLPVNYRVTTRILRRLYQRVDELSNSE